MKAASDMDLDHPLAGEEKAADELPKLTPSEELSRKDLESAEDLGDDLPIEKIETPKNEKGERIYYDMTLVVPTDALPAKLGIKNKKKRKKAEKFDQVFVAKRLVGAGLSYRCYKSIQEDEVYIRVGATQDRLGKQADVDDFKVQLDPDRTKLYAKKGYVISAEKNEVIAPIEIPNVEADEPDEKDPSKIIKGQVVSRYEPWDHIYGSYDQQPELQRLFVTTEDGEPFSSMQRLKLLWAIINADKRFGGAAIPVDKRIRQGRLLAAIGAHDPQERNDLFDTFVKAPLLTPPLKMDLDKYKNYFGEKQGLAMVFLAHLTNAYFIIGCIGLAIQLALVGLKNRAGWPIVIYGFAVILWSVFVTEFWKRDEKRIAMLWGIVGFEQEEEQRPQFKGVDMPSPATGEDTTYYAPRKRAPKIMISKAISAFCILIDLGFIAACIKMKQSTNHVMAQGGVILQAIGIPIFSFIYTMIAVKLTDIENWETNTRYQDELTAKLTIFNFINSYTALAYAIFIPHRWVVNGTCDKDKRGCFEELSNQLMATFIIQISTNNFLQTIIGYVKYRMNYAKESKGADGAGYIETEFSVPELQYLLAEFDEILDNIISYQAQATQYGYITLFSVAFPAAAVLSFVNNWLLMRFDCAKFLTFYRRITPDAVEDIGIYQSIFEMLNVVGAVSTTAIVVYRSPILGKGGRASQQSQDAVFIGLVLGVVTGFFCVIKLLECCIDDVHHDVALQIERQEFIQSKIIDRVADEDDDLVFVEQKKKLVVRDKDDLELYYKTIPDYFEQDDGRKLTEIPDRTSTDMIEGRY